MSGTISMKAHIFEVVVAHLIFLLCIIAFSACLCTQKNAIDDLERRLLMTEIQLEEIRNAIDRTSHPE